MKRFCYRGLTMSGIWYDGIIINQLHYTRPECTIHNHTKQIHSYKNLYKHLATLTKLLDKHTRCVLRCNPTFIIAKTLEPVP